jgi:hypothetical protein
MPSNGPSRPKPREWETNLVQPIVEGGQVVGLEVNRDESHQLFADLESILFRMGGACVVAAVREPQDDGSYVTTGYKVTTESFMPAVQRPQPQVNMGLGPQPPAEAVEPTVAPPEPEVEPEPGPPPVSATEGTEVPEAELEPATAD